MHVLSGRFQVTKSTRATQRAGGNKPSARPPSAGKPLESWWTTPPFRPPSPSSENHAVGGRHFQGRERAPDCLTVSSELTPPSAAPPLHSPSSCGSGGTPLTRKVRAVSSSLRQQPLPFCMFSRERRKRATRLERTKVQNEARFSPDLDWLSLVTWAFEERHGWLRAGTRRANLSAARRRGRSLLTAASLRRTAVCVLRGRESLASPFLSRSRRQACFLCVAAPLQQRTKQLCLLSFRRPPPKTKPCQPWIKYSED